jgi:hypothetical protein
VEINPNITEPRADKLNPVMLRNFKLKTRFKTLIISSDKVIFMPYQIIKYKNPCSIKITPGNYPGVKISLNYALNRKAQ